MTIDEYATDVVGLDDDSGPTRDPQQEAMIEHLVEFETEMFRLDCRRRISSLSSRELFSMMVDLHGKNWLEVL